MVNAETLEVGGKTKSFLTYSESLVFGNCDDGRWPNCLRPGNWEANLYTDDMQMPFVEILILKKDLFALLDALDLHFLNCEHGKLRLYTALVSGYCLTSCLF